MFLAERAPLNIIEKFPFSSDDNSTDVGDLTVDRLGPSGQSSSTHGYTSGGHPTVNVIDKFTFSADANATDVGDLTEGRGYGRRSKFNNSWLFFWWW